MQISKILTRLCDEMLPKTGENLGLGKIFALKPFFSTWGVFRTRYIFTNQHKILHFLLPNITYFKKKFSLRRAIFSIFGHKNSWPE
jgi:hypothetical protein